MILPFQNIFLLVLLVIIAFSDVSVGSAKNYIPGKRSQDALFDNRNKTDNFTSIYKIEKRATDSVSHSRPRRKSLKMFQHLEKEVKAQISTTAILPCGIRYGAENNYNVTWFKASDGSQLTYGNATLTYDRRFSVKDSEVVTASDKQHYMRWDLQIALVSSSDEGAYECWAITSSGKNEKWNVYLRVVEAKAEILGDPQKFFKVGSTLRLSCYVEDEYEDPKYIFWYLRDRMINFDMTNGINIRIGRLGSELVAPRAEKYHAGNYSCVPSNARPANVTVYVYKDHVIPTPPSTDKGNGNFGSLFSFAFIVAFSLFSTIS